MRRVCLAVMALVLGCCPTLAQSHACRLVTPVPRRTVALQPDRTVRTFDLGSDDIWAAPSGWSTKAYNDARWGYAQPVPASTLTCMHKYGWPTKTAWFGSRGLHNYLFRQSFTLPPGPYGGGLLYGLATSLLGEYPGGGGSYWVNGSQVRTFDQFSPHREPPSIIRYLHEGRNVIGLYLTAASTNPADRPCNGFEYSVTITFPGTALTVSSGSG